MLRNVKSGIYEIRNVNNGKRYVGSSKNLAGRKNGHWDHLQKGKHQNLHLQRAWDKHGKDAFVFEILTECCRSKPILLAFEQFYMDALKPEYNNAKVAGSRLGSKNRPGHRTTNRDKVGKPKSPEQRAKIAHSNRICRIGKPGNPVAIEAMRLANRTTRIYGPKSEEVRRKIAETGKGNRNSSYDNKTPEQIAAQRLRRSEGQKLRFALATSLRK